MKKLKNEKEEFEELADSKEIEVKEKNRKIDNLTKETTHLKRNIEKVEKDNTKLKEEIDRLSEENNKIEKYKGEVKYSLMHIDVLNTYITNLEASHQKVMALQQDIVTQIRANDQQKIF